MKRTVSAAFAAVLACAALAPLPAQAARLVTYTVHFGDLDLATASGRAVLDQRLDDAVWAVCGRDNPLGMEEFTNWHRCLSSARASVRRSRTQVLILARGETASDAAIRFAIR